MKRIFTSFKFMLLLGLFCTTAYWALAQEQDEKITLKGQLINLKNHKGVPFANIRIKNSNRGTATDSEGKFYFKVNRKDTLLYSSIGYLKKELILSHLTSEQFESLNVFLEPSAITLDSVQVFANDPMEWLYRKRNEPIDIKGIKSYKGPRGEPGTLGIGTGPNGAALTGGIEAIANMFSKRVKEKRKLEEILQREAKEKKLEELRKNRLKRSFVSRHLQLSNTETEKFLAFYQPSELLLSQATDYQLIKDMKQLYFIFLQEKMIEEFESAKFEKASNTVD